MTDSLPSNAPASNTPATNTTPPRRIWLMLLPLAGFVALTVMFWYGLHDGDPSRIP